MQCRRAEECRPAGIELVLSVSLPRLRPLTRPFWNTRHRSLASLIDTKRYARPVSSVCGSWAVGTWRAHRSAHSHRLRRYVLGCRDEGACAARIVVARSIALLRRESTWSHARGRRGVTARRSRRAGPPHRGGPRGSRRACQALSADPEKLQTSRHHRATWCGHGPVRAGIRRGAAGHRTDAHFQRPPPSSSSGPAFRRASSCPGSSSFTTEDNAAHAQTRRRPTSPRCTLSQPARHSTRKIDLSSRSRFRDGPPRPLTPTPEAARLARRVRQDADGRDVAVQMTR